MRAPRPSVAVRRRRRRTGFRPSRTRSRTTDEATRVAEEDRPLVAAAARAGGGSREQPADRQRRRSRDRRVCTAWVRFRGRRPADGAAELGAVPAGREAAALSENGGNGNGALTAKDFRTDQEVRWCPGCGDYAILAAMQSFMPELGI